jgi:tRNA 2-thiouridine synthesizing protein E
MTQRTFTTRYAVDDDGFLLYPEDWDEDFAIASAASAGIADGLTDKHWAVIRFIRDVYEKDGMVPLVYVTCMNFKMRLKEFKRLFPAGYHRGACRLAGTAYWTAQSQQWIEGHPPIAAARSADTVHPLRAYRTDTIGFLLDAADWDRRFAEATAAELGMPGGLTEEHWRIIEYLREAHARTGVLPTLYATCEDNDLELADLQRLFPDGYHRGAVRLAGLRFWRAASAEAKTRV